MTIDLLKGVGTRLGLHFSNRQMFAVFFLNLNFNRHAVAIPARHISRIEAGHVAAFDDDVFQDFVDGMPDVDVAIRVGWAIVQ